MKIKEATQGTFIQSTIKSLSHSKDGCGAFQTLLSNYTSEVKHCSISKKRLNLLQNIKWNGQSYTLKSYVSKHRQAYNNLLECSTHIQYTISGPVQKVEYLIDSIAYTNSTL